MQQYLTWTAGTCALCAIGRQRDQAGSKHSSSRLRRCGRGGSVAGCGARSRGGGSCSRGGRLSASGCARNEHEHAVVVNLLVGIDDLSAFKLCTDLLISVYPLCEVWCDNSAMLPGTRAKHQPWSSLIYLQTHVILVRVDLTSQFGRAL